MPPRHGYASIGNGSRREGGIGSAPFLSVLRETAAAGRALPATLFYSNRRPEDAVGLDELRRLEDAVPGFRMIATMTRMAESAHRWDGETGRLGAGMLARHLHRLEGRRYWIVGAPTFISGLRRDLIAAGVAGADIGVEAYVGY